MTKQRTIAALLMVFCVLLAMNLLTPGVAATPAPPAEAGIDGTCPSDINGDSAVNVLDLVDLLLDFGTECPGPQLVDITLFQPGASTLLRVWSDGFVEYKVRFDVAAEPQVWTAVPPNPNAPPSRVVAVTSAPGSVYRLWSDGVIEDAVFDGISTACLPDDGVGPSGSGWQVMPETMPLPHGVRITRIFTRGNYGTVLLRLRSDGVVEQNFRLGSEVWCGWRTPPE